MLRKRPEVYTSELAQKQWNASAEAYAEFQASGDDFYRIEFFGPAQIAMCGDVSGMHILDVGCGSGYLSRELAKGGGHVTGVDISDEMIRIAREHTSSYDIEYHVLDAAKVAEYFNPETFDLATACVSLQDMPNPADVIAAVNYVLRSGSRFVFCGTHPCTDTPYRKWVRDNSGKKIALEIGGYFDTGPVEFEWKMAGSVYGLKTTGIHAKISDWINWSIDAGFVIKRVEEPIPPEAVRKKAEPFHLPIDSVPNDVYAELSLN